MYRLARIRRSASSLHVGNWLLFLALALFAVTATAQDPLTQAYCSSQNTAETDPTFDRYQSNGACRTTCQANFALAIVQGTNCWCSNTLPADQTDVGDCNKKCPGYPFENCGNADTGLFGYVLLNKVPSGSADAVAPSSPSTATPPPTSKPTTSSTTSSSSTPPPASTPGSTFGPVSSGSNMPTPVTSVIVSTISNKPVTKTVTSMPTAPAGELTTQPVRSSSGPSAGLIAGIVFAVLIPVLVVVALGFCCWRRRRILIAEEHTVGGMIGSENPSSRPTRTTSVLSRTGLLEKVYPSAGAQRSYAGSRSNTLGPDVSGPINPLAERRNSRPLFYDQRLNPATLMDCDNGSRVSVNTLPDNRDFSRTLNIRNPDPHGWD